MHTTAAVFVVLLLSSPPAGAARAPSIVQSPATAGGGPRAPLPSLAPLGAAPAWTVVSDQDYSSFGFCVAPAGDVNGDGFSDVIVGAQYYDNGQTDEGRALVYLGSAAGLSTSAAWVVESNSANARFGHAVASAGDVNGDGYDDVIVGAPLYDGYAGAAFVYLGSASGLATTPAWTVESSQYFANYGIAVATAGDVNGDGYDDILIGADTWDGTGGSLVNEGAAFLYLGSASGLSTTPAWSGQSLQAFANYGHAVASAGDVNGDGYCDVVIGADMFDNGETDEGRAFLYLGGPSGLATNASWTGESNQQGPEGEPVNYGHSVAGAGDVNGDGFADVIVGARHWQNGYGELAGKAYIYLGSAAGLSTNFAWTVEGDQRGCHLGECVATAGDVNGDGFADVVIGAFEYTNSEAAEGRVYLYLGAAAGPSTTPAWITESNLAYSGYGGWTGTAGDVNGDGFSDVIVGASGLDEGLYVRGFASVYLGSPAPLHATPAWTGSSGQASDGFGASVAFAGDVNGDGYTDLLAGAYATDAGVTDAGRVSLYLGSRTGPSPTPLWSVSGTQLSEFLGISVAGAGDVNGDGYADIVVGAHGYTNGQTNEGAAFLYLGGPSGPASTPAWTAEGNQPGARFGCSVASAGDVNGDGYADVIVGARLWDNGQSDEGRAFVFAGGPSGLSSTPLWTAEGDQDGAYYGVAVASAGDVNRDGYSDVIVGADYYDNGQTDEGRAFLYLGGASGPAQAPSWTGEGNQSGTGVEGVNFGGAVASAGDVNGDGYSDVIIGARHYHALYSLAGRAYVYLGSATGLASTAAWTVDGDQMGAHVGQAVASAGDVNGDGFGDVLVGAYEYTVGQSAQGRAYLYLGSASGLATVPAWTADGDTAYAGFGGALASAGDTNGDGFSDAVIGAAGFDGGLATQGRGFLFYGNDGDGLHRILQQVRWSDAAPIAVLGASDSQTSFRLHALGRTPLGRGRLRAEWEIKPLGMTFTGTGLARGGFAKTGAPGADGSVVALDELAAGLQPATAYHWRLRFVGDSPFYLHSPWFSPQGNCPTETDLRTAGGPTDVARTSTPPASRPALAQPSPNPFERATTVRYSLPRAGHVRLAVTDVGGREIAVLVDETVAAGTHRIVWNGIRANGTLLPAGLYLLRLETAAGLVTRRVMRAP
jgi:hypothetical protein